MLLAWLSPSFEVGKLCGSDCKGEKLLVAELNPALEAGQAASLSYETNRKLKC